MIVVRRQEKTIIPNNAEGKAFANEYKDRLRRQGALNGSIEESNAYIIINAEYTFSLLPDKKGEPE